MTSAIARASEERGIEIHEEIHVISEDDSQWRVDNIVIHRGTTKRLILDSTVGFERDVQQAEQSSSSHLNRKLPDHLGAPGQSEEQLRLQGK